MPDLDAGYVAPDWVQELIEECAVFPNGMNDDQVDALSQALNWIRSHARTGRVSSVPEERIPEPGVLAGTELLTDPRKLVMTQPMLATGPWRPGDTRLRGSHRS